VLVLPKLAKPRPTEPEAQADAPLAPAGFKGRHYATPFDHPPGDLPDLPPWMKCETLAGLLAQQTPGLRVVHPDPSAGVGCVCEGDAEPPGVPATEEYADCRRGVVRCEADPPADVASGPHGGRAGDFYQFGDMMLVERLLPTVGQVRFGPWRGVGGPATPPP
jgi:hypothetical protein